MEKRSYVVKVKKEFKKKKSSKLTFVSFGTEAGIKTIPSTAIQKLTVKIQTYKPKF